MAPCSWLWPYERLMKPWSLYPHLLLLFLPLLSLANALCFKNTNTLEFFRLYHWQTLSSSTFSFHVYEQYIIPLSPIPSTF
jgi:hypothetical protein